MTNQDVVVPDMGIAAAAALPPPGLFACRGVAGAVSSLRGTYGSLGLPGGAAADGGEFRSPVAAAANAPPGRTSCTSRVVEAIRASSPARCPAVDEYDAWTRKHPSALGSFDQIAAAAKGKRVVMFMDYDGTLSPIVADPDMAFMTPEMRAAVRNVAKRFPTAIVTGRCIEKVCSFVGLPELYYAGSHGMDIKGPNSKEDKTVLLLQPAREFLPVIDKVHLYHLPAHARTRTHAPTITCIYICIWPGLQGSGGEDEGHDGGQGGEQQVLPLRALQMRRRKAPRARVIFNNCSPLPLQSWSSLAEKVKAVLRDFPELELTEGRKVVEVRPSIMWDKGKAVEFLLRSLGFDDDRTNVLPVYIGDDRTDEDAFKVLRERGQGIGILVSKCPKETDATYSLQDPTEVMEFLVRLGQWNPLRSPSPAARPRGRKQ
ncbi:trehalose-6-phosphate phosphatase10 [Zea mays]|uniref:Trehalose 6-phosphate phosphatase n=1 Tax=Zea mays TaxID=4577 RepID=A0A1D6NRW1_MAIZE|nr:trehalose-6-phosphate phosphatase10 [Zea mays]